MLNLSLRLFLYKVDSVFNGLKRMLENSSSQQDKLYTFLTQLTGVRFK